MAISIWAYAEKRCNGIWQRTTELVRNPDYYSHDEYPDEEPCPYPEWVPECMEIGDSRIYAALLINERHAWSIDPIVPVVPERGFPIDACPEVTADFQSMETDVEHANWVTLEELEQFPWKDSIISRSAMVSEEDAQKFSPNQQGLPNDTSRYSEWASDGVRVSWTSTYLEAFGEKHLTAILLQLHKYGPAADVRLVLWCDR